jgi:N-acetylglucosamine-6-phosphate deacetylase
VSHLVVRGGEVLTPDGRVQADVEVRGGRISRVVVRTGTTASGGSGAPPPEHGDARVVEARGLVVVPGFVDLQCNGAGGIDLTTSPERLWEVAALLPRWGVTAWLPTVVTSPEPVRQQALVALQRRDELLERGSTAAATATAAAPAGPVATPLGVHFEGPFLASERRGVHVAGHLRLPQTHLVSGWSRDAGVAVVTLAPELPGALSLVRRLVDRGVVVSLGHSAASADEASAAVDAGARWVTHLFNAMGPLHHRDPGLVGVALTDERLAVGVIADGLHLHPLVVRMVAQTLGGRLTLVSDAVAALGMPPGLVRLGDTEALADEDGVRMADGTLAGSLLSLDRAVGFLSTSGGMSLEGAVAAATVAPARVLGIDGERGVVAPGAVGDLVLLDVEQPATPRVVATAIGGEMAYADPAWALERSP